MHINTHTKHTRSEFQQYINAGWKKSAWLVEVSAFLGVGPSEHTRLVTPPDMEMQEAWPSAVAAYWTINFHFNMTLEDIEAASVSSLREKNCWSLFLPPFLSVLYA